MYLAVALAKLDDVDNAAAAYERAIELDDDMVFRLNYGKFAEAVIAGHAVLYMNYMMCFCSNHCEQLW